MSFGKNLYFLRQMHDGMTQEKLADIMGVSRQTVSKWELDLGYPEIDKIIELCRFFSCSIDQIIKEDLDTGSKAYSEIRIEKLAGFNYIKYVVVSEYPEADAINHLKIWTEENKIENPQIIGWNFKYVSQEQINVYHMHGYVAGCILPSDFQTDDATIMINKQYAHKYCVITIREPSILPFVLIPNAYKTMTRYIEVNKIKRSHLNDGLTCYEQEYIKNGISYMDIYMTIDN